MDTKLGKLRALYADSGIDGLIITGPENRYYMSGFSGSAATLVISADNAALITDFRYVEQARAQAPEYRVYMHKSPMTDTLREVVREMGATKLGFESDRITFSEYDTFAKALEGVTMLPVKGLVESIRQIKSEHEIELIARAVSITDDAFDHVLGLIKPGVAEAEIANELLAGIKQCKAQPRLRVNAASQRRGGSCISRPLKRGENGRKT